MKFLIAFAAVAAVAVALPVVPSLVSPGVAGPAPVVDESGQIIDVAAIMDTPVAVGPAIVQFPHPGSGGVSAVKPVPVVEAAPIQPSPVVIGDIPAGATPLVQIIVNVNQQEAAPVAPIAPIPVEAPVEEIYVPGPVNVVDGADLVIEPVAIVNPVLPGPVNVVDGADSSVIEPVVIANPVLPGPVNVVDGADSAVVEPVVIVSPVAPGPVNVVEGVDTPVVEPVIVGTPIIPAPVIIIPDELN